MTTKEFQIDGMSCNHCVMAVKKELSKLELESLNVQIGLASVNFDDTKVKDEQVEKAIEEAGYKIRK